MIFEISFSQIWNYSYYIKNKTIFCAKETGVIQTNFSILVNAHFDENQGCLCLIKPYMAVCISSTCEQT